MSAALVSAVRDAMLEDVVAWHNRPQEPIHAIVSFNALRVKILDKGLVPTRYLFIRTLG